MTRFSNFRLFSRFWFSFAAEVQDRSQISRVTKKLKRSRQSRDRIAAFVLGGKRKKVITMIVNMSDSATEQQIEHIIQRIREAGFQPHVTRGTERTIVAAVGSGGRRHEIEALSVAPGVDNVVAIAQPFKLVSRQTRPQPTVVDVCGVKIGGPDVVVIAGPCSVESREQLLETAHGVKRAGAAMLRGGAYKPRTSPYEFQGLGIEALKILREAREQTGLPVVTEVMSTEDVDLICEYADMLQVGARNMQNFALLRRLATTKKPILLKRGPVGYSEGVAAGG